MKSMEKGKIKVLNIVYAAVIFAVMAVSCVVGPDNADQGNTRQNVESTGTIA